MKVTRLLWSTTQQHGNVMSALHGRQPRRVKTTTTTNQPTNQRKEGRKEGRKRSNERSDCKKAQANTLPWTVSVVGSVCLRRSLLLFLGRQTATTSLTHSPTHTLTHSRTHSLTHSRTHSLTQSPPQPANSMPDCLTACLTTESLTECE